MRFDYIAREARITFRDYKPIYTEFKGVKDLTSGVAVLVLGYFVVWKLKNSNNPGTRTQLAAEVRELSGNLIAEGLIKLTVPIIFAIGYQISKSCL